MPRSLDPTNIDAQRIIENGLAEPLVVQNDDATLAPGLAASWSNVEPTLWEFTIQPNATFWSGAPVDAAAVKAALERHQKLNKRASSVLGGLQFVVKDPGTLQIRTPNPDPGFAFRLTTYGIHNAAEADRLGAEYNARPDLTGYMKPTRFVPGEVLVAEWNPNYRIQPSGPHLRGIDARLGTDSQARQLAVLSGDVDGEFNVEVDSRVRYEQRPDEFDVYAQAPTTRNVWMNMAKVPALKDKAVRQALNLSVDRGALIEGLNRGFATPATGHFPAGLPYALDSGPALSPDIVGARKLLDDAGWVAGPDGVRGKDGHRLEFSMLTYAIFQPLAIALQSQWKDIGVGVELNSVETTASNQLMIDGDFEVATYCSCGSATGDLAGQLKSYYRTGVVSNYGGFSDPDVDRLIDQLGSEFDPATQIDLAHQVQDKVSADVAVIYLFNSTQWATGYSTKVQGVDPNLSKKILPTMWLSE
ncbi:ABC transporter substrate-binding protein [Rhodococcus spelaei]|nr:ABC transporter substrate-binding protein [Rhodococcus spelaei]